MAQIDLELNGDTFDLVQLLFKQVKCALTFVDQLGQHDRIISKSEVLHESTNTVKCYFSSGENIFWHETSDKLYCIEFIIGAN